MEFVILNAHKPIMRWKEFASHVLRDARCAKIILRTAPWPLSIPSARHANKTISGIKENAYKLVQLVSIPMENHVLPVPKVAWNAHQQNNAQAARLQMMG